MQVYAGFWIVGLALVAVAMHVWLHTREAPAPTFEFGGRFVSVVSIRAATGKYLEVSSEDGLLRATGTTPDSPAARFRVHVLSAATVTALRAAASTPPMAWSTATGSMTTSGGCACTGFSNEHFFGRYCHPWEVDTQAPWCYVGSSCAQSMKGSFGRHHAECSMLGVLHDGSSWPSNSSAAGIDTEQDGALSPLSADELDADTSQAGTSGSAELRWEPPAGCACSGVRSALGFGPYCRAWEYAEQTPWCYVGDNCSLASATSRPGSFGYRFIDCVLEGGGRRLTQRAHHHAAPATSARRLAASAAASATAATAAAAAAPAGLSSTPPLAESFPRRDPEEDALLEKVEQLRQPYVALVSLATEGFVSVELPPHRLALRPHARTDALSMRGVFSFLPSGAVLSLATNALFNLCPIVSPDPTATPESLSATANGADAPVEVCTGFLEASSAHLRLLRSLEETQLRQYATYTVQRHAREVAPRPVQQNARVPKPRSKIARRVAAAPHP